MDSMRPIFERITEYYEVPIRVGSRCEAKVYYRIEDLSYEDITICAEYIGERILKVCSPNAPQIMINLQGSYTELANVLSRELSYNNETLEVFHLNQISGGNGHGPRIKGANVILVNDVITTARSCLEAHTKITMMGASILCWAALIDRTFGPGPVPVVAAYTGEPVRLLEELP